MSIGSKIKALRRAKDLTQEELAEVLGVSSKAVSQWERGRTVPDISQLPVLCNFFEVTADELLGMMCPGRRQSGIKSLRRLWCFQKTAGVKNCS